MSQRDILSLLSNPETIKEIFFDWELHQLKSFFVINSEHKGYEEGTFHSMQSLYQAHLDGKTIVIKNLEKFIDLTDEFGPGIDIHAYIVPNREGGDSFDWHTDDRSVWVKMLYGTKLFGLRNWANETRMDNLFKVHAGNKVYIPKGQYHIAHPMGASCLLSVGLPDSNPIGV